MKKSIFHYALSSLLVGGIALSAASCADDDINPSGGTDGDALVRFSINDVQEQAVSRGLEMTRGAIATGLSNADLAGGRLEAHNNAGLDVCLIETTVEGVNPIKADARTRADIIKTATLGDFSSTGIRGTSATSILSTPEWFKAQKTKKNGELYSPIRWAFSQPYARFFAVHPAKENYSKMTINDMAAADIAPSVDFEVEPNVRDQKDFMTACTGDVHYATRGVHPTTNLDFRHALTGIRFAVGQNLSWNKTIDKVEIRNAVMKSKYTLSKELNGTGATWHIQSTDPRGTATLSGVSVSTSESPNTTIMGNAGDNFTFYMIPQMLTGKGVTAYVHCTDGTEITAPLKGEWKAGTTRTYKLSQTNSTWQYTLTSTDPSRAAECNETTSQPYSITSYREDPVTHTKQAVAWKVIGYSVDNGTTWSTTKPAWLTALSAESGNGGTAAETGTATLTKDVKDLLKERNDGLKNATAVGTSSAPYDLSTHDLNGNTTLRSTANSYLISAPGHYRIPLVYGNAIKNGSDNPSSYQTSHTGTTILSNFQDHAGNAINDPWIEKTNGGANAGVNGAKIVWADEKDLVTSPSIAHDASNNAYLDFEVKAADIKSGNAVVAVTKGGTVVWSWHLWFAPQSALTPIPVTNYQNKVYNFTEETLGWKPTKWEGSTYNTPRTVKVRVEQTIANNGTKQVSDITITQNPGTVRTGIATLYQFGRKDALPGMDETQLPQGSINKNAGNNMSITNGIQYPDRFYMSGSNWNNNYGYYNLWSADNMVAGSLNVGNDNPVVKTVYDPSPVGFKMPANNAFTGFTADGQNNGTMNVDGTDDLQTFSNNFGHNFWTSSSKTATIHFPASGYRSYDDGSLNSVGYNGYYWSAVPGYTYGGCSLSFKSDKVNPLDDITRSHGVAVRPVSE